MSNTLGLTLLGLGIGLIVMFVMVVQYMTRNYPDTAIGRVCVRLDKFVDNLPDD